MPHHDDTEDASLIQAEKAPKKRNVADRPHNITIMLGIVAVLASLASAWFSSQALLLNRSFSIAGQRAYLTARQPLLEVDNKTSGGTLRSVTFTIEIYNGGNTPAHDVVVEQSAVLDPLASSPDPQLSQIGRIEFLGPKDSMLTKQTLEVPLSAVVDKRYIHSVEFRGSISYLTDFDDKEQKIEWCQQYSKNHGFSSCRSIGYISPIQ